MSIRKTAAKFKPMALAVAMCVAGVASASAEATQDAGGVPDALEQELLRDLLIETWEGLVPHAQRVDWRVLMLERIDAADPLNLRIAAEAPDYEQAIAALGGMVDASDPLQPLALGSTVSDLVYTPTASCRIVDTRAAGGPIAGYSFKSFLGYSFNGYADQGGEPGTSCGVLASASALVLNVTVVNPASDGYATVYPGNLLRPAASTVNFTAGTNLSNSTIVRLPADRTFRIYSHRDAHYVVDVVGQYAAPEATALQCVSDDASALVAVGDAATVTATCATGYSATGGGCFWQGTANAGPIIAAYPGIGAQHQYTCRGANTTTYQRMLYSRVRCCRVPGR